VRSVDSLGQTVAACLQLPARRAEQVASFVGMLGLFGNAAKQLLQPSIGPCAAADLRRCGHAGKHPAACSTGVPAPVVLLTASVVCSCRTPSQQHSSSWMTWQQQHRQLTHRRLVSTTWQGRSHHTNAAQLLIVDHTLQGLHFVAYITRSGC
jgi:hypothetical protein